MKLFDNFLLDKFVLIQKCLLTNQIVICLVFYKNLFDLKNISETSCPKEDVSLFLFTNLEYIDQQIDRQIDRQIERQIDRLIDRQKDRKIDRQIDRQID